MGKIIIQTKGTFILTLSFSKVAYQSRLSQIMTYFHSQ